MDRRTFIITTGAATAVGLAGCLGDSDTGSPEDVIEAGWDADDADEIEDLLHPDSPLEAQDSELTEEAEELEEDMDYEVTSIETIDDDVDSATLEDEGLTLHNMTMEELDDVAADHDVALVEQTIEFEMEFEGQTMEEEEVNYTLTATDNGDWLILDDASEMGGF